MNDKEPPSAYHEEKINLHAHRFRHTGVKVAGGQAHLKGHIFRIAHMGIVDELDILATLSAIELVLDEMGHSIEFGVGPRAAQQVLAEKVPAEV